MELIITEKLTNPSICLNMIVKNESHIIKKTLENLCSKIDFSYWVICDTGSTDNTCEIIVEFFSNKNILGELHKDEWQDFAHNRTLALQKAFGKSDLLLVFDADDEIVGQPVLPGVNATIYDEYHLKFGSPLGTAYTRVLLVNNMKRFVYQSVIHEYIVCVEPANVPRTNTVIEGDYYVVSGRSGSRSLDPEKYLKDAKILEAAHAEAVLKNDPLFKRYAFYCANSYKDYGSLEDAIKWYKITLGQENWAQEHYMSCFHIYECYLKLQNLEQGFFYLVKAFKYDHERVECLYPLLVHYCCEGQYKMAYNYYLQVKDFYETKYLSTNVDGKLFVSIDKYNFFMPYYMILIADKMEDYGCVIKMFEIVFTKKMPVADDYYVGNILFNLQFFVQWVKPENMTQFINLATEYIRFLSDLGIQLQRHEFLREYETRFGIDVSYIFSNVVLKNKMNFSKEECKKSKNILIYTGYANVDWNYSYLKTNALGGSEKAVAYLSKELASLLESKEYHIYVAGVVQSESFDNVTYVKLQDIPNLIKSIPFNTVICSRYISFLEIYKECAFDKFYIWAHDIVLLYYGCNLSDKQIITKWDKYITGCICQTEWHANLFKDLYPELTNKITAINNGLDKNTFLNGSQTMALNSCKKQSNKFIYSSRPERGLDTLLQLWPQILDVLPDAELVLATYGSPPDQPIIDVINKYSSSIKYLGKLNTEDLYKEMKTAEYWLYPTKFTETSCITGMEMLMSEVICLYYPVAGLINTMDKYGIQIAPGNEIETLLNLTVKQKLDLKINGKKYALSCSWENRAKEWANVIFSGEQEEEEIKTFIRNLHNTVSMPQNHTNYLKKLAIDFEPKVIYDIGSSVLHWTREAHKIWPNSEIIAFDAFQGVEFFYKEHNIKYHIGVLSKEDNYPVKFYENSLHSAGNSYYKEIGHSRSDEIYPENVFTEKIAMKLNTVVKNNHFLLPDLIKMDVQGAELDIIKGGLDIINNAKYLIVELQDTEYNRGAPLAATTIKFLEENGWELIAPKFCDNGPDADYCFKNKRYGINMKNIAIFNSFPFHYEMFGYIIEYCQKYNHNLTIFTNFEKDLGWLDFYKNHFKTYHFEITDIFKYKELQEIFDITFITTDDDYKFMSEWINDKCIVVDHTSIIRRPKYKHRIGTRSFINNYRDWAIPCYKVFEKIDKTNLLEPDIHIAIIGGNNSNNSNNNIYNYDLINKIYSEKHIHLHVISRNALSFDKNFVKELINITIYDKIETTHLFDILKKCDYMLTDFTFNNDYINGTSISGNIPLAFSTLTPLIISKQNNALYKFKNVIEFDMETAEKIYINKNIVNLDELSNEREFLISMFASYIDDLKNEVIYLRFFSDEGVTNTLEHWMSIEKLETLYNNKVILTNGDNYTHAIIINTCMPKLNIPKQNIIGISHEPNIMLFINKDKQLFIEYAQKHIDKYFVGDVGDLPKPFIEGQIYFFYNKSNFYYEAKNKFCSFVISEKNNGFHDMLNYKYRHDLVKEILTTNLPIDIYGHGIKLYNDYDDPRIKHPLEWSLDNPFGTIPFEKYKFHICIENVNSNHYFSEKIINPLLSNVIPIYYGCKNIDNYFYNNNIIKLSGDTKKDVILLGQLFQDRDKDKEQFTDNYQSILNTTNIFNNLHKLFDNITLKNNNIKIYVIHYKKLHERKEFMINQFKRENIFNYEFITIDRDELTENDTKNFQQNMSKPLIANFLSHLYAYKQIETNLFDYNLILEDDAVLCSNFSNILQSYVNQFSNDYDAVFIGNGTNIMEHRIEASKIIVNSNVYKYDGENKCKCTDSYFISKKGACYIINYFNTLKIKIDQPIDWFLNKPFKSSNVYWCEPPIVKQGTIIGLFNSSVGNGMLTYTGFNPNVLTCYKSPFKKIRVGKDFDGGYVICDIPNINYDLLLGCGVDVDISFESQFCNKYKNALCYLYDGSVNDIYLDNKNMTFFKKYINNFNDENNTNLHEIIDKFNNIFLKMDIEGYEIPWIKSLSDEKLNKISQIVMEFHYPFEDYKKDVFEKINKYFIMIHFHANNCCGVRNHNGIIIPNVFECTYLNRKFFNNNYELNTDVIPSVLDMKNVYEHDEIYIDYEPFVNK